MKKAIIRLAYKYIIDSNSSGEFSKHVFEDSYQEFLMQIQSYNKDNFITWDEIRKNYPKANQNVPYKTAFAIGLYVRELGGKIPGLKDSLERFNLSFDDYSFEIIQSETKDKSKHKVAIIFNSEMMTLLDVIGEYMLVTSVDNALNTNDNALSTFMIKMQPHLSISSWQEIVAERAHHFQDRNLL